MAASRRLKAAPYWKARRPWGRGCGRFFLGFAQAYLCKIGQTTSLFTSQSADLLFRGVAPLTKKPEDFWFVVFASSSSRSFEQVPRARMSIMPSQHLFPLMLLTVVSSGFAKGKLKELSKAWLMDLNLSDTRDKSLWCRPSWNCRPNHSQFAGCQFDQLKLSASSV